MSAKGVYFKNLNGVRFLAALVVIIHHMEMGKAWLGQPNIYTNSFVGGVFGQLGIILFFVLSGFLITYLLLEEHSRTGTISIKSFYMRRILRIWPVYYLVVLLSLFVIPQFDFFAITGYSEHLDEHFGLKSALYLSFLPNIGYSLYTHIPYAAQTWSVGVEEQFYIVWPLLMLWAINRNKVPQMLFGVIVFYLVLKTVIIYLHNHHLDDANAELLWEFWDHFSIDCMAIGGAGAYLLFNKKERVLNLLFNKYLQVALFVVLAVITVKGWVLPWYNTEWYALLFVVIILNLSANKNSLVNLEFKPLNYLGKISYGLYMYHSMVLFVVLKLIIRFDVADLGTVSGNILYYVPSLGLTIILSALSYQYYEKWFLALKGRFAKVRSGEQVETEVPLAQPVARAGVVPVADHPRVL